MKLTTQFVPSIEEGEKFETITETWFSASSISPYTVFSTLSSAQMYLHSVIREQSRISIRHKRHSAGLTNKVK
jgi:hypothetical protein